MRLPSVPGPGDVLALVARGGEVLEQLLATVPRLGRLLDDAERLIADVDALVTRIEATRQDADAVVAHVEEPARRADALLAALEPSLLRLQPTLERLADTTDPREVDALVGLVDHLPALVEQLERDIMPVLSTLTTVAPDLHDLLDVSRELNGMLGKLPGMAKVMQRIDARQARLADAT
jgi:ABC-type transporter Mla subunit MlaD